MISAISQQLDLHQHTGWEDPTMGKWSAVSNNHGDIATTAAGLTILSIPPVHVYGGFTSITDRWTNKSASHGLPSVLFQPTQTLVIVMLQSSGYWKPHDTCYTCNHIHTHTHTIHLCIYVDCHMWKMTWIVMNPRSLQYRWSFLKCSHCTNHCDLANTLHVKHSPELIFTIELAIHLSFQTIGTIANTINHHETSSTPAARGDNLVKIVPRWGRHSTKPLPSRPVPRMGFWTSSFSTVTFTLNKPTMPRWCHEIGARSMSQIHWDQLCQWCRDSGATDRYGNDHFT